VLHGHTCTGLANEGHGQALKVGTRLRTEHFDAAYVSDTQRAQETAAAILKHHVIPIHLDERLREMHMGALDGQPVDLFSQRLAEQGMAQLDFSPEGGETFTQLTNRVRSFYDEVCRTHAADAVLVVTHAGVIRTLLTLLTRTSPEESEHFQVNNTAVSIVEVAADGSVTLTLCNCTEHLR
jgi:2,3-bisphosphoglycerate-dependent phosphoglycerate mutase